MSSRILPRPRIGLAAVLAAIVLAACGSTAPSATATGGTTSSAQLAAATRPPSITIAPADLATNVTPDTVVTVTAKGGALSSVAVIEQGSKQPVAGTLSPDGSNWTATGTLTPGQSYSVTADASSTTGGSTSSATSFSTLGGQHLITQTDPSYNGEVVGVGMPIKLVFNTPIAPAEQANLVARLQVTSTPAVVGGWHWFTDEEVHFRPENYWPSGTTVTVNANLLGFDAGNGYLGYNNWSLAFTIGPSHVSIINHTTEMMQVYFNGTLVQTIPVALGKVGFPTISGTLVVWYKSQSVLMDSCTSGIDCQVGSTNYYDENVYWDTAISTDGFFIHDAYWDIFAQGHYDYSHGCVNISPANAIWFFDNSQVGDVVTIENTSREANFGDGEGDWQIPYAQWANSGTVA